MIETQQFIKDITMRFTKYGLYKDDEKNEKLLKFVVHLMFLCKIDHLKNVL